MDTHRPQMVRSIIGLGSNMGDKPANIAQAIAQLTADAGVRLVARSRLYRTAPWGVTDQDWFANACILVETRLSAHDLLRVCQRVENDMGRIRERRWGPRIIDVDILTYGDDAIDQPDLVVPHPRIAERAFVLVPMKDVAPDLKIGGATLDSLIARAGAGDVELFE